MWTGEVLKDRSDRRQGAPEYRKGESKEGRDDLDRKFQGLTSKRCFGRSLHRTRVTGEGTKPGSITYSRRRR